jgi:hypothetical protein
VESINARLEFLNNHLAKDKGNLIYFNLIADRLIWFSEISKEILMQIVKNGGELQMVLRSISICLPKHS